MISEMVALLSDTSRAGQRPGTPKPRWFDEAIRNRKATTGIAR